MLVPQIGLVINDFVGGVEFFKALPSLNNPSELRSIPLMSGPTVDADVWLGTVKDQVAKQAKQIHENPNQAGFIAAFTSPMTIYASGKIYSTFISKQAFNGVVEIQISTDGKFFMVGKMNFAADLISIGVRMYADLSKVASAPSKFCSWRTSPNNSTSWSSPANSRWASRMPPASR